MISELLTENDIKIVLQNYLKNDGAKYISSKFIPLSNAVDGFMGDYCILEITFLDENEEKSEKFFVKSLPTHSVIQMKNAIERNVYGKEIFFYDFLMQEFKKYGYDTAFAPECYYCKDNKALIMENLVGKNFKMSEKTKLNDLNLIKAGLSALALCHGASILYEEEKTKKLGRSYRLNEEYPEIFKENYFNIDSDDEFAKNMFFSTVECIQYVIDINKDKGYKDEFKTYLNSQSVIKNLFAETSLRKAVGHGDLWHNNIFFSNDDPERVICKLVDFQTLRYSFPVFDVLLFVHLYSNQEFRKSHLKDLLIYYHDSLSKIFSEHGYDISKIFPLEEFNESIKFIKVTAMYNVVCIGFFTFMPQEVLQDLYDNLGDEWDNSHIARFKKAVNDNQVYRKVVSEIVDDLYNSWFENKEYL